MSFIAFLGAVELGLVYSLPAFGIFISFRILNIPDLTADGSFVLGAAVSAVFTAAGHPVAGIAAGITAGAIAGIITAVLQTKCGIAPILSGILTMTGLYTINLLVMGGRANMPLLNNETVFTLSTVIFGNIFYKLELLMFIVILIFVLYYLFFKTQLGLSIRATGDNEDMVRASSIDTDSAKMVAFAISNATIALSGALVAQMQQSADINMGTGLIVIGLASLIIGDAIIKNKTITRGLLSVIFGAVLYRLLIALILTTNLAPSYLKLISALVVAVAIAMPTVKKKYKLKKLQKKEASLC